MSAIKKFLPGEYCWADMGTPDPAGSLKFYKGLFGWKTFKVPMDMTGAEYTVCQIDGKSVCGIYPARINAGKRKSPPFWLSYISVKDASATLKKAKSAGAKVCGGLMEADGKGRMAILQDPTGAFFAIWEPLEIRGAQIKDIPGTFCWHDLNTRDTKAAPKFYTKVFGWKMKDMDFSGNAYHLFKLGKKNVSGMWPFPMEDLATSWLIYFQVADCAKAFAKAKKLGASVMMETCEVPGAAIFAVLKDPQGAAFAILQFRKGQRVP